MPVGKGPFYDDGQVKIFHGDCREVLPTLTCSVDSVVTDPPSSWFKKEFAGDLWKGGHPAYAWEPIIWAARPGLARYYGPKGGHNGRDVLVGNHSRHDVLNDGHPCPKPLNVVRGVVAWTTPPGGLVLDPFVGSGTTLRAAKDLSMSAIGIERNERYCEIAAARLAQEVLAV